MLVGKANIDRLQLEVSSKSVDKFITYADSLVPELFRDCRTIICNQRYLCCLTLRKLDSVPWDVKREIIDSVMRDISIIGCTDELIEINKLCTVVDMNKVMKYLSEVI